MFMVTCVTALLTDADVPCALLACGLQLGVMWTVISDLSWCAFVYCAETEFILASSLYNWLDFCPLWQYQCCWSFSWSHGTASFAAELPTSRTHHLMVTVGNQGGLKSWLKRLCLYVDCLLPSIVCCSFWYQRLQLMQFMLHNNGYTVHGRSVE